MFINFNFVLWVSSCIRFFLIASLCQFNQNSLLMTFVPILTVVFIKHHISTYYDLMTYKIIQFICFEILTNSGKSISYTFIINLYPFAIKNINMRYIPKHFEVRQRSFELVLSFLLSFIPHCKC